MVPVAGNVMREELAALMLDTAAVSSVLKKPLGVRVLPIPGAEVNELTDVVVNYLPGLRVAISKVQGPERWESREAR